MTRLSHLLVLFLPLLPFLVATTPASATSSRISRNLQEDDHSDHDHAHGDDEAGATEKFEWAGVFHLEAGSSYVLTVKPPAHSDEGDDHDDHDHRLLQVEEGEEDHDHDGDGVADHSAEEHMDEEYHFFVAVVPVDEHGQAGIDQAMTMIENTSNIQQVENGDTITPSASQIYELYFPAATAATVGDDINNATATSKTFDEVIINTLVIDVAEGLGEDYVIMLPGRPSEVAGSDKILMDSATGEKLFPEDVRVLHTEENSLESTSAAAAGNQQSWRSIATFGAMGMLLSRLL